MYQESFHADGHICMTCLSIYFLGDGTSLTAFPSFLSTSNEQVYKVFNTTECEYSRDTCKPEVSHKMSLFFHICLFTYQAYFL